MEEPGVERTKCQVCISGCKQVTTFTLSHVGLLTLVVCYCLVGAAIFEALEADHEKLVKQNITKIRKAVARDLWNMTQGLTYIQPSNWSANATERLKIFENELVKAMKSQGWDGSEDTTKQNWSTLGALFYSIIVITTIGYGHIAPKTMWGRITTMFYAIIGIPLMVVCWSHIGDFMANSFRLIYWKACCYLCTRNPIPSERVPPAIRNSTRPRSIRSRAPAGSMRMKSRSIRRSGRTSQRSADSALSGESIHSVASDPGFLHVGTGSVRSSQSHAPHHPGPHRHHPHSSTLPRTTQPRATGPPSRYRSGKSDDQDYYLPVSPDLKNLPVLFNRYAEDVPSHSPPRGMETMQEFSGEDEEEEEVPRPRTGISRNRTRSAQPVHSARYIPPPEELEYWDEEEEEEDLEYDGYEEERYERRPVPIWLCAFLVISYIIGGAFLFSNWEGWGMLDSAYFCFITLTTIGFGDFVPARRLTTNPEVSIALCSLYLLFGIALLAMSFNLVQEQVINAFKDLALRLGIISEEDEQR